MYSFIIHSLLLSRRLESSRSEQVRRTNQICALNGTGSNDLPGNRSSVSSEGFCENEQEPDAMIVHSNHSLEQEETDSQGGGNYFICLLICIIE